MTTLADLIRSNSHIARLQMIAELSAHWNEIEQLAIDRAEGIGVREYGNASFRKPPSELRRERFEEYADALFYYQVEHQPGG